MSLFSSLFQSASNEPNDNNNNNNNDNHNDNQNNDNNDQIDQKNDDQIDKKPLYKIVQEFVVFENQEKDFYSLSEAVAYWESLSYLCAAIWYQWDDNKKIWKIKDTYGTSIAIKRIINYIDKKYKQNSNNDNNNKSNSNNSLLSYLNPFSDDENTNNQSQSQSQSQQQSPALLDDFFKWTEIYTKKSGITPISQLNVDNNKCDDLIVSLIWNVGFQCYWLESFDMAKSTWSSLGSWYSSVWFTRHQSGGIFVLQENYGTSDNVRRICRFVNDAQSKWNSNTNNDNNGSIKFGTKIRPLIDNNNDDNKYNDDNVITTKGNGTDDDNDDDNTLCIVCLDGDRDHIILPCGHICLCQTCKPLYENDKATCPMCRSKVEKVIKTFK